MKFKWKFWQKKPPRDLRLLVHIRYKDNTERYERIRLAPQFEDRLKQSLICAPLVREARVYREVCVHHKSFADDFEINENFLAAMANGEKLR